MTISWSHLSKWRVGFPLRPSHGQHGYRWDMSHYLSPWPSQAHGYLWSVSTFICDHLIVIIIDAAHVTVGSWPSHCHIYRWNMSHLARTHLMVMGIHGTCRIYLMNISLSYLSIEHVALFSSWPSHCHGYRWNMSHLAHEPIMGVSIDETCSI